MSDYITKDSGERLNFNSGMQRDVQAGKPRFDLLIATDDSYENCLLTRWAKILARGAEKYCERNWEKANSIDEFNRFKSSAFRHFVQFIAGEDDEDHAAAVLFNINGMIYLMNKLNIDANGKQLKQECPNPKPEHLEIDQIFSAEYTILGYFPNMTVGDGIRDKFVCIENANDGFQKLRLLNSITRKELKELEKKWSRKFFGGIDIGDKFTTKSGRYKKVSMTEAINVYDENHITKFSPNTEIISYP